ncbi:MAG: hypothetical protein ACFFCW_38915 [Candidatus Hodarchaeota archaeon]
MDRDMDTAQIAEIGPGPLFMPISGTYKNTWPANDKIILELRVDVDGRRPQQRISGDVFRQELRFLPMQLLEFGEMQLANIMYKYSFVIENVVQRQEGGAWILTGPIIYYNDPTIIDETIEVRIQRVLAQDVGTSIISSGFITKAPDAIVNFYKSGNLVKTYVCPKISSYFRSVKLEIDCIAFPKFPQSVNTDIDPSPADLPARKVTVKNCFQRAGIDMKVQKDDVLIELDIPDPGLNWDFGELHDLMEAHFDRFSNTLNWNLYGVVVPRFAHENTDLYRPDLLGVMFDLGRWQAGDTYHRQGAAVSYQAIESVSVPVPAHSVTDLYDTDAEKDRLFLETFIHELGHVFNLPHTFQRTVNRDDASQSFMNYTSLYTGGTGTDSAEREYDYWSDFRWEFDDVELVWMRHQDRNDVIFGGNDWIGDNLITYIEPEYEISKAPLRLELNAPPVVDFAEPVRLEIKLTNISDTPQLVIERLDPEDQFITLYIHRPNGDFVRYVPPVRCDMVPGDLVELAPGESIQASVLVSFSAKGHQFQEPGEYRVRAYYGRTEEAAIISKALRLRVAAPTSRQDEELAYLLFDHGATKFLYFNGTERYPDVTSKLEEAVLKYDKTNPRVVRHIRAALGVHASRYFKRIETKKGKRVVVARKPNLSEAITHLQKAMAALPDTKEPAVDVTHYAHLAHRLAKSQVSAGKGEDARKTLDLSVKHLNEHKAGKRIIDYLEAYRKTWSKEKVKNKEKKPKS